MLFTKKRCVALLTLCVGGCTAQGTIVTVLVADRTAHKVWRLTDLDNNGTIEPSEVFVWFDETNAASTLGIQNLTAFNYRVSDNLVVGGDNTTHAYYFFKDLDHNGDAMAVGESKVVMTTANGSGASLSAPTGIGFLANGDPVVCNSGSTTAPDAMYVLHDFNGNGSYDDAGDVLPYMINWPPSFTPGNSPYTPFEITIDRNNLGYLHNSSSNLNGVYKFRDLNANARVDDAGEFAPFFDSTNASGITVSAGFSIDRDISRADSFYINQIATGGVDQIIRLTDLNHDGDANDAGEAVLVYSTAETGFAAQDILVLPGGDLLISDVTGKRVIKLTDNDNDGLYTSAGERTTFFTATGTPVLDTRQLAFVPSPITCGTADFDGDGDSGTDADIEAFFACLSGNCCATCFAGGSDFNADGDSGTDADIESFFRVLGGGPC